MATAITGVAAAGALAAYTATPRAERPQAERSQTEREDCPGKIICPITGELICADQCPAEPGKTVELPVTDVPACCAGKD